MEIKKAPVFANKIPNGPCAPKIMAPAKKNSNKNFPPHTFKKISIKDVAMKNAAKNWNTSISAGLYGGEEDETGGGGT